MKVMRNRDAEWRKNMDEVDQRELDRAERVFDAASEQLRALRTRLKQKYIKRMRRAKGAD